MSSQTIDGVSRADLQAVYDELTDWKSPVAQKLRALLDTPVPFPGYPPVPDDRKLPAAQPQDDIDTLRAALRTEVEAGDSWRREALALREKLEAQPQGEPDAYSYKVRVHATGIGMVWRDKIEREAPDTEAVEVKDLTPLYTERPAPVASGAIGLIASTIDVDEHGLIELSGIHPNNFWRAVEECGATVDLEKCVAAARKLKSAKQAGPVAVVPKLEMAHVVRAHMGIPCCPVLTSNQCYALAMNLNTCLDELSRVQGIKP